MADWTANSNDALHLSLGVCCFVTKGLRMVPRYALHSTRQRGQGSTS